MTEQAKKRIDSMTEEQLRVQISKSFNHKEIVEYCEKRLDRLNRNNAQVEPGEVKVGEV